MSPDDGPDYWMAQLEQERQEQEAADALRNLEHQSKKESGNEHRNFSFGKFWNRQVHKPSEFEPFEDGVDPMHQKAASIPGYWLEDASNPKVRGERHSDK